MPVIRNKRYKSGKVDCPYCDGSGEVFDGRRVHSRSLDPPMSACPECGGCGYVDESDLETSEGREDWSLDDYDRAYEESAAEAKWERDNER